MEKIQDTVSKQLPALRLYLDELKALHEFLSQICKKPIAIRTCGYKLNTFDELSSLPKDSTHEISFNSLEPYLSVELTSYNGRIYLGDTGVQAEGIAAHIEKILLTGKIFHPNLTKYSFLYGIFSGLPLFISFFGRNSDYVIFGLIWMLICFAWLLFDLFYYQQKNYNTIIFHLRKETPNFWKRNMDKIIMLIIGTIFGALVTSAIELLVK
jgi:hypothetical protein